MIHSSPTSDPSYAEGIAAAGELSAPPLSTETAHQVLEAQFQIVSGRGGEPYQSTRVTPTNGTELSDARSVP